MLFKLDENLPEELAADLRLTKVLPIPPYLLECVLSNER